MKLLKNRKGFTLVEIIVVLVILGILLAIAVPNVIAYIDKANDKSDQLAARNVYLAAVTEAAEYYAENKAVPAVDDATFKGDVVDLAGADLTLFTAITFDGNKVDSVTYNGVTYNADGTFA